MTINLLIDQNHLADIDELLLENALRICLEAHNQAEADVTIKVTDDEEMRILNQTYRDIDKTTDVLSFNQDTLDPETGLLYLGDIILSIEQALIQADENNHSLNQECTLLAIHGCLHLLGYDHYEPEEKAAMWAEQERILRQVMLHLPKDTP